MKKCTNFSKCPKCNKEFNPNATVNGRHRRRLPTAQCYECLPYAPLNLRRELIKCKKCQKEFHPVICIDGKKIFSPKRTHCYECSEYKPCTKLTVGQNGKRSKNTSDGLRPCSDCGEYKPLTEYSPREKGGVISYYCKKCGCKRIKTSFQKFKQKCIDYKGGKCLKCGYRKNMAALEFHHRNPEEKEFSFSKLRRVVLNDEMIAELDKCDLLCANCHRETHHDNESNSLEN